MSSLLRHSLRLSALLCLLNATAWTQVTVCPGGGWTTGTTHVAGTGSNRLLVVAVGGESGAQGTNDFTGVTYGGQALTLAGRIETDASGFANIASLWYLDEAGIQAATGTTIAVTVSGSFQDQNVAAVTYCNVDQIDPIGNVVSDEGSGGSAVDPITVALDIDAMHAGVAAAGCGNAGSFLWSGDLAETTDQQATSSTFSTADMTNFASAGLRSAAADFDSNVNRNVLIAAEINDGSLIASFSGAPTSGVSPLNVAFTDTSSGTVSTWSWDFGDGDSSSAQNPNHTYTASGIYTVSLMVTGPGGSDTSTRANYIVVTEPPPVADFSGSPTAGIVPLAVQFTDESTGAIAGGFWDFGDGNTVNDQQNPLHTYTAAGVYTVSLTVNGPGGADTRTRTDYITVSEPPPAAGFSGAPRSGVAPLEVLFSDASSGGPITEWSWDFGDGGSSSLQNPAHTYSAAGTYSVALTVTGPGGSDTATEVDYVVVAEPAPVADFSASPLNGYEPLDVAFTNLSTGGPVTDWSWDFGDGGTSTVQEPMHTYANAGTYTVSLTATGPGGSSTATRVDYIVVDPLPVFADGSFEQQVAGNAPAAPWSITSGSAHVINPLGVATDNGMPTDGSQWAEVGADGTNGAVPPSNPGGAGSPPIGAAGISQVFTYEASQPHLYFQAAFILGGAASSASFNDFMSVDVTDGTTTHNLYYADTFSTFPNVSAKYGLPMTDVEVVAADLRVLFPGSDSTTVLTLTIQAGNGGDDMAPSKGYVDRFAFAPDGTATTRNGSGVNALCLTNITPPALGTTWTTRVDHSGHPAATFTILVGKANPTMGIMTPFGELLVSGLKYYKGTEASSGTFDDHNLAIPVDLRFPGLPAYVQAVIAGGAGLELCNALDVVIGF